MLKLTLKNAKAHLGRFLLSIIAVALGTSFIVATFCFQTVINSTVDSAYASSQNADVFVRGPVSKDGGTSVSFMSGTQSSRDSVDVSLVDDIKKSPDVLAAYPSISKSIVLVGDDDLPVHSLGTVMARGMPDNFLEFSKWQLLEGSMPKADNEIVLEQQAYEASNLKIGDTTKIVDDDGPRDVKVVGEVLAPSHTPGELLIGINQATAEKKYLKTGTTSQISVWGKPGVSQDALAQSVQSFLPSDSKAAAVTGDSVREEGAQNIKDNIGFVQNFIIIFAIIALFVGCFIIANTFSMIVHESLREYALLRAIGASSSQVFQTVILQAVVIGIFGSVLGLLLGTGLVQIIPIVLKYMGASIDQVVFPSGEQIAIVLAIGLFISLFAAIFPARKAGSTPPVAAMSEAVLPSSLGIVRTVFGSLFFIIGLPPLIAINNYDWFVNIFNTHILDDYKSWAAGVGASAIALSALLLGPLIIRPIVWLLSSPVVWVSRVGGKLARNNILRNFKSSANTASALLIGIALVSCCCVLASSASASVASIVTNNVKSDLIVMDENMKLPTSVIDKVENEPGVNSVNELYLTQLKVDKENLPVISVGNTFFEKDVDTQGIDYTGDPLYSIEHGEAVVPKTIADSKGYKIGDIITIDGVDTKKMDERKEKIKEAVQKEAAAFAMKNMRAPTSADIEKIQEAEVKKQGTALPTKEYKYTVGSIVDMVLLPGVLVNNKEFDKLTISDQRLLFRLFVTLDAGQDLNTVKSDLQNKVKDYYTVSVLDKSGVNNLVAGIVNQVLALLYGLLALSIFIALLGIINTLTLSVVQRTREIGLLRAVGLSNGGLTVMLALESLLIALFGTILGIVIGVNAAVAIQKSLQSSGFSTLSIPWEQIGVFIGITVAFALIACLFPARRAKKMPVLDAISAE